MMPEFIVVASESRTGEPYPLFIVVAENEDAARRMSRRRWLNIDGVRHYAGELGEEKPPVLPWGPPASDRVFEKDYHNRPADPDGSASKPSGEQALRGGLLFLRVFFRLLGL